VAAVLEVVAHASGPWLVKVGEFLYAVPPGLGRALLPLAGRRPGERELRDCLVGPRPDQLPWTPALDAWLKELSRILAKPRISGNRSRSRPIRGRIPLIRPAGVRSLARGLRFLTGKKSLTALTLLGVAGYALAGPGRIGFAWDLGTVSAGLGLFLLTALWHELGHAAALARSGYPPGGIGAGILFVIPVLFADVSALGALPRSGRLRVDVAGVVFQLAAGGLFMAGSLWPQLSPRIAQVLVLGGSSALLAVVWSLLPFLRSDGYWLLCDLLKLDDLDRTPALPLAPGLRLFLIIYQLSHAAFLLGVGIILPWRISGVLLALTRSLGWAPDADQARWLAPAATLAVLALLGPGITRKVAAKLRSACALARNGDKTRQ
jgi:hypothetical protein